MDLAQRDKKLIWHPFTQEKMAQPVLAMVKGCGSYLYDQEGKAYLDLISSWWVNIHGHANPVIAQAIYKQAQQLEHIIFAGFTHEPAVELCEILKPYLPQNLKRFFFSDNGSTAVEVALKMAYQYWKNRGQENKKIFLSFDGGYHGDTFGAMAVGLKSGFHTHFTDLCFQVLTLPYAFTWQNDRNIEEKEQQALAILKSHLDQYGTNIAALIVEPLVQGAIGMHMCRPEFLKAVIEQVRTYGILVIFDEVMTGFGRTGTYFALDQLNIVPDFLCLSKALTGGFLPLALTVTNDEIFQAFLDDKFSKAFAHGHSYTANPLACSAGIASFKLLEQEATQIAIKHLNQAHKAGFLQLEAYKDKIERKRICGTIAAFDIKTDPEIMDKLKKQFLEKGLLLRPLGQTLYLLPPYSTTQAQIADAYQTICKILDKI